MQIIGHRGARKEAPENTLGGFKYIAGLGLRAVEFDVRLSKDKQLVVIHDASTLRTAGVDVTVSEKTAVELAAYSHTHLWPEWQEKEPTPTLTAVLACCKNFNHIEVEVKAVDNLEEAQILCPILLEVLAGHEDNVSITSFDSKILHVLQSLNSSFKRGLLIEALPCSDTTVAYIQIIAQAKQLGCSRIGMFDPLMTLEFFQRLKESNLQCSVWTVNDIERARELEQWGVHGLITDRPSDMLEAKIGTVF